jgi:hypothetical protein
MRDAIAADRRSRAARAGSASPVCDRISARTRLGKRRANTWTKRPENEAPRSAADCTPRLSSRRVEAGERGGGIRGVRQIHGQDAHAAATRLNTTKKMSAPPTAPGSRTRASDPVPCSNHRHGRPGERAAPLGDAAPERVVALFEAGRRIRHGPRTVAAPSRPAQTMPGGKPADSGGDTNGDAAARLRCRVRGTKAMQRSPSRSAIHGPQPGQEPGPGGGHRHVPRAGIGANTAIFSLIRTVMLTSLPVKDADRLVLLHWHGETWPKGLNQSGSGGPNNPAYKNSSRSMAYPFFRQLSAETSTFETVFAFVPLGPNGRTRRWPPKTAASGWTARWCRAITSGAWGASPAAGRLISRDDEARSAQVAVISYAYWSRRFAADPSVVGREITINHLPFTIVGVTSQRFFGVQPGRAPDVWVPMLDRPDLVPWGFRPSDGASLLDHRRLLVDARDGAGSRTAWTSAKRARRPTRCSSRSSPTRCRSPIRSCRRTSGSSPARSGSTRCARATATRCC